MFADEDKLVKERIEAKNGLENYAYTLKNQLNDEAQLGGKVDADDKTKILDAVKEKTEWLEANGATATKEEIEAQKAELEAIVNPITSKLYGGAGGPGGPGGESGPSGDDEDRMRDEL